MRTLYLKDLKEVRLRIQKNFRRKNEKSINNDLLINVKCSWIF